MTQHFYSLELLLIQGFNARMRYAFGRLNDDERRRYARNVQVQLQHIADENNQ